MRNEEEFSGQRRGFRPRRPTYRRGGARGGRGSGRIRYAHGGALPRIEPYCAVPRESADHHGSDGGPGGTEVTWGTGTTWGVTEGGNLGTGIWPTEFPVGGRHSDVWVLVCGGIAAAAAFTAAFVASGGVASHPAAPAARMPAVVSQACPVPAPGPTP
jgi:hypothetical protein